MKSITVLACLEKRYRGETLQEEISLNVEDNATEEEIDDATAKAVKEWVENNIEWYWCDVG